MNAKKSAFNRVRAHMTLKGCKATPSTQVSEDVEMLVRDCDQIRSLGREYGEIELSPYMSSLLRVSRSAPRVLSSAGTMAVASL